MGAKSSSSIGTFSKRLTERGLIYSSKRGQVAFTVPHFDRYVLRAYL
jgi:cysteinyl-tRNA synthetase